MAKNHYIIHTIDPNTFVIEEKTRLMQALCYLLCGSERALLIDTGSGYDELPAVVKSLTRLPVTVANTHAHVDYIGGNHFLVNCGFVRQTGRSLPCIQTPRYTLDLLTEGSPRPVRTGAYHGAAGGGK